jgi:hypothetical protein
MVANLHPPKRGPLCLCRFRPSACGDLRAIRLVVRLIQPRARGSLATPVVEHPNLQGRGLPRRAVRGPRRTNRCSLARIRRPHLRHHGITPLLARRCFVPPRAPPQMKRERGSQLTLDLEPCGRPPGLGTSRTPHPIFTQQGPGNCGVIPPPATLPPTTWPRTDNLDDSSPNALDVAPRSR